MKDMNREIIVIAHNLRSCHNVGSLLRTAEGMGVAEVWLTGYTPYPKMKHDRRMPHLVQKIDRQIHKTSLGAEESITWAQADNIEPIISQLKSKGYTVLALEQTDSSQTLHSYKPTQKLAIVLGREVEGIEPAVLDLCDVYIEIPMFGKKESLNVVQAAAMALYHMRFN
jgi:23S rRNA (guanosine2251-2'-O)-methyltransferase